MFGGLLRTDNGNCAIATFLTFLTCYSSHYYVFARVLYDKGKFRKGDIL